MLRLRLAAVKWLGFGRSIVRDVLCIARRPSGVGASDPYVTHLPVLAGLSRLTKTKRVLELGSGFHSSTAFLDRTLFKDLVELHSVENDPEWARQVGALCGSDARFRLTTRVSEMCDIVADLPISNYDLIFIDDSRSATARSATIRMVVAQRPRSVVVIHDFEEPSYREASKIAKHHFTFDAFRPHVGVVWENAQLEQRELKSLRRIIARYASPTNAGDLDFWRRVLDGTQLKG